MATKTHPRYIKVNGHVYKLAAEPQPAGQQGGGDDKVKSLRVRVIPHKLRTLGAEISNIPVPPFTADSDSYTEALVSVKDAINTKVNGFLMEMGSLLGVKKPLEASTRRRRR